MLACLAVEKCGSSGCFDSVGRFIDCFADCWLHSLFGRYWLVDFQR